MIADPQHILAQHDVSPQCGFLPHRPPLKRLDQPYYQPWETFMDSLPVLIAARTVRPNVKAMPILEPSYLITEEEWRRAYVVLSFMTHAYIWGDHEPSTILPPQICYPYLEIAEHFGLPSTATYTALNLWNWAPKYPGADLSVPENIRMLHTFTGTTDEEWFYLISIAIEAEGAKIIPTMLECFDAVRSNKSAKAASLLEAISSSIVKLGNILDRMHEKCDPYVFYRQIRPFLAGSKGMSTAGLPNGVFYDEGSGLGSWRQYSGGSNAQSSLIQLMDIMLGVEHFATDSTISSLQSSVAKRKQGYILEMRRYMPEQHKQFLQHITNIANIRQYATRSDVDPRVRNAYVKAVESLTTFRDKHINIVARYIVAPSRMSSPTKSSQVVNIATASTKQAGDRGSGAAQLSGTGGTHLLPFLRQTRDETRSAGVF